MQKKKEIFRKYYISFGELKKKLGIEGELFKSNLWEGLSFTELIDGKSRDTEKIEIVTIEKIK